MAGMTKHDNQLLVWDDSKTALIAKLGQLVQYFQVGIPENSNGIPACYIDPAVLTPALSDIDTPDDLSDTILESSKVEIIIEDGVPVVDGIPFWERLDGEPIPYYNVFKQYRDMKYLAPSGGRQTRSIARLSEDVDMIGKQLSALSKTYHWSKRCLAYDIYKENERNLMKENAIESLENKHAAMSNKLLDQAVNYLLDHPEQMSPKTAIELTKLAMEAGRLSVGLDPSKPGRGNSSGGGSNPKINIYNQNANVGEGGSSVQASISEISDVQKKTQENSQDVSHLQSILHVLNASGAFSTASGQVEEDDRPRDASGNVVDAEGNIIEDVAYSAE